MIKLGQKVRCKVTGFTGIAVAKSEYLNGGVQFCVKPKMKAEDTKMPEEFYIDVEQLEVISDGLNVKKKQTGGVMADTPKTSNYTGYTG